jgi:hypothetical protein
MDSCVLAHHWLIDALPTRGSYHAKCKNCGEEREFPEDANRFKFRIFKKIVSPPVTEQQPGLPAGASPPGSGRRDNDEEMTQRTDASRP